MDAPDHKHVGPAVIADPPADDTSSPRISTVGAQTFVTKVLAYSVGLLTSLLIVRAVGPAGRGQYYLPVTAVTIAYYVANLGLHQAQFRSWASHKDRPALFVTSAAILSLLLGGAAVVLTWLFFLMTRESVFAGVSATHIWIVLPAIPILTHSLLVMGLLTMSGRLPKVNKALLIGAVAQGAGAVAFFVTGHLTVTAVLVLYLLSIGLPWVVMLVEQQRIARPHLPIPGSFVWTQLKLGLQFGPAVLFMYLNLRLDVFFLARFSDLAVVGIYSIAVLFAELVWLLTDAVSTAIAQRQLSEDADHSVDVTARAIRMSFLLVASFGVLLSALAYPTITLLYGSEFSRAAAVVWVLLPASATMAIWRPASNALVRFGPTWLQPAIALGALSVNVIGNLLLIPPLGMYGAAWSSGLSYSAGAALSLLWLFSHTRLRPKDVLPTKAELRAIVDLVRRSAQGAVPAARTHR